MSKTKKIIIGVVAAVLLLIVVGGGIYCIATKQNPVEAVQSVFASNEEKLVGKWQSQSSPGLTAYVFYDDGTYDSYLSTVNFSGEYTVKGNKLTLINPDTEREVVYKFKLSGSVLTLTLIEDGEETDETKYDSVDELEQKTLSDIIGDAVTTTSADSE